MKYEFSKKARFESEDVHFSLRSDQIALRNIQFELKIIWMR